MSSEFDDWGDDVEAVSERRRWLRRALWLAGATVGYNAVEAGVALFAGLRASSIALVAFGLDSVIEMGAAAVVFRRVRLETLGAGPERIRGIEARVERVVGITLLTLATYVGPVGVGARYKARARREPTRHRACGGVTAHHAAPRARQAEGST